MGVGMVEGWGSGGGGLYWIMIYVVFCIFYVVSYVDECCVRFRKIDINFIWLMIMMNNCSFKLIYSFWCNDRVFFKFLNSLICEILCNFWEE